MPLTALKGRICSASKASGAESAVLWETPPLIYEVRAAAFDPEEVELSPVDFHSSLRATERLGIKRERDFRRHALRGLVAARCTRDVCFIFIEG